MNPKFSGAASAARIIGRSRWDSECGFGVCSGDPNCSDKHCPGHPCQAFPIIDEKYLDAQLQVQFADAEFDEATERDYFWFKRAAGAVVGVALLVAAYLAGGGV